MQRSRVTILIVILAVVVVLIGAGVVPVPRPARVAYWSAVYKFTKPADDQVQLVKLHKATQVTGSDGKLTYKYTKADRPLIESESARCIACHGPMTDVDANGKPNHYIHRKMLTAPMLNFSCTDCHKDTDIRKRSPSHVTMRVDRTLCPRCHNPSKQAVPAELSAGKSWGAANGPEMPQLMIAHGGNDKEAARKWIKNHPRVGMAIGIDKCRACHIPGSELDFCRVCHLRGGFRPAHHKVVYSVPVNRIYPKSDRTNIIETRWKGFHFVFAREALAKQGVIIDGPRNLPLDKVSHLPCGACHILKEWCTRCHIKHNPNWLDPTVGHPAFVAKYGTKYCFRCHDVGGAKCVSCHNWVGQLK